MGYDDATAMVVCAYSEDDKNLYVVETFSASKLIVSSVANKIKELDDRYDFIAMVIDQGGGSKQAVEEMRKRYSLPLIAAEKEGKRQYIEMLNSDLLTSTIKLLPPAKSLSDEWDKLVWDETKKEQGKWVEHSSLPNHLSDAFLYAWRWSFQYASYPKVKLPSQDEEAYVDKFWEAEEDKLTGTDQWF
jgi:hypothetical protein